MSHEAYIWLAQLSFFSNALALPSVFFCAINSKQLLATVAKIETIPYICNRVPSIIKTLMAFSIFNGCVWVS